MGWLCVRARVCARMHARARVRVRVRVCECACGCACTRACLSACSRSRPRACAYACACACARVCACACACASARARYTCSGSGRGSNGDVYNVLRSLRDFEDQAGRNAQPSDAWYWLRLFLQPSPHTVGRGSAPRVCGMNLPRRGLEHERFL